MNDVLAPIFLVFLSEQFQITAAGLEKRLPEIEADLTEERLLQVF